MTRYETLTPEQMTPEQRKVVDNVTAGPRGSATRGPFMAWLPSPKFADLAQALGAQTRFGFSQGIIDAIHRGEKPASMDAQEEAIWQFAKELLQTQRVSEPTFAKAKELFGQKGVVDLVGVMGYYGLVSMTLNTFQVPLPEGEPLPFKE